MDIAPNVDRSVPVDRLNPDDPILLERIYRQMRHADHKSVDAKAPAG